MTLSEINIFKESLGYSESRNRYYIDNGQYWGKYQFGNARRKDIALLLRIPTPTRNEFTPDLQELFFITHVNELENKIYQNNLDVYIGNVVKGKGNRIEALINMYGLIAGAHLGGFEGMKEFLLSDYRHDPKDSNNTHISDYVAKFSLDMEKKTEVLKSQVLTSIKMRSLLGLLSDCSQLLLETTSKINDIKKVIEDLKPNG